MITNQQRELLQKLIDKYENRQAYGTNEKLKRRVMLGINKKDFPEYFHAIESSYRKDFNLDCIELDKYGYINCEWQKYSKGEELKRIILVEGAIPNILHCLGRKSKSEIYKELKNVCIKNMQEAPDILHSFYEEMLQQINNFNPLPAIFSINSLDETKKALYGLNQLFLNDKEYTKRKWSILLYNDSKEFELYEKRIVNAIKKFVSPDKEHLDTKEILESFGISSKPLMVKIYGKWIIQTPFGMLDFAADKYGIGIHPENLEIDHTKEMDIEAVVTIENETSYYDYLEYCHDNNLNHLVIYLGGFHNTARKILLGKIKEYISLNGIADIEFFHWGDIDLGGMQIYNKLCDDTGIHFTPLYMGTDTYLKFVDYGTPIKDSYCSKVSILLEKFEFSTFHDVIQLMIKYKKKIEQEIIHIK